MDCWLLIEVVAWELVGLQPPADLLARVGGDVVVAAPAAPKKPMSKGVQASNVDSTDTWRWIRWGLCCRCLFDTPPVPLT